MNGSDSMQAVAYARFSSDNQRDESIDAQLRAIDEYADKHGITVSRTYIDRAFSAKTDHRPEFRQLMQDAEQNATFDAVLIHKYDRFSRNRYDHAVYGKHLNDRGIRLIAVAQDFGAGKEAILLEGLTQSLSEYYIANLAEEVKKGHKENAMKALHNGGYAPFGYDVVDRQLRINEAEAVFVRRMYDACRSGLPYRDILRDLETAGIRGRRGRPMVKSSIYEILRNEKYTGTYLYVEGNHARRDKTNAIRIEDAFPAIVDRDTWEEVQRIMDSRKNGGKAATGGREYLCSGLVYCGECGAPMHASTSTRKGHSYSRYACSAKCGVPTVRCELVDDAVAEYLRKILQPEVQEQLQKALTKYIENKQKTVQENTPSIKKEIGDRTLQMDELVNRLTDRHLPGEAVAVIGNKIAELKRQIDDLQLQLQTPRSYTPPEIRSYLNALAQVNPDSPETLRGTLRNIILRITAKETEFKIESILNSVAGKAGRGDRI